MTLCLAEHGAQQKRHPERVYLTNLGLVGGLPFIKKRDTDLKKHTMKKKAVNPELIWELIPQ